MSNKVAAVPLPFNLFSTVSIYDATEIWSSDGTTYRLEQLDPLKLPWEWWIDLTREVAVRAFKLDFPLRVLAGPATVIPRDLYVIHGLGSIWAMTPEDFETTHVRLGDLIATAGSSSPS